VRVTELVPAEGSLDGDVDTLTARVSELESTLRARQATLDQATSALAAFEVRYRQDVGLLHEELDELDYAIAEAELGELAKHVERAGRRPASRPTAHPRESAPRYTTDAVRRLFRDVAKIIHPDLGHDDHTRHHRHRLMIEANRAYASGDEDRLRWILDSWENSPEAVTDNAPNAVRQRLARRIAQIERELVSCTTELAALQESPLWKLKVLVDEAAGRGKDLVADMVRRLKRDIMVARNRLDAIQSRP
jgi:hypothetical protein